MTTIQEIPTIEPGDSVQVDLPGVAAWKIPAQRMTATVTRENVDALRKDVADHVNYGNATVTVTRP